MGLLKGREIIFIVVYCLVFFVDGFLFCFGYGMDEVMMY